MYAMSVIPMLRLKIPNRWGLGRASAVGAGGGGVGQMADGTKLARSWSWGSGGGGDSSDDHDECGRLGGAVEGGWAQLELKEFQSRISCLDQRHHRTLHRRHRDSLRKRELQRGERGDGEADRELEVWTPMMGLDNGETGADAYMYDSAPPAGMRPNPHTFAGAGGGDSGGGCGAGDDQGCCPHCRGADGGDGQGAGCREAYVYRLFTQVMESHRHRAAAQHHSLPESPSSRKATAAPFPSSTRDGKGGGTNGCEHGGGSGAAAEATGDGSGMRDTNVSTDGHGSLRRRRSPLLSFSSAPVSEHEATT